jgi:hypothetical protein
MGHKPGRKPIDIPVGAEFGYWRVLAPGGGRDSGAVTWQCQCVCSNIRAVRGSRLRSGQSRSCGCMGSRYGQSPRRQPGC